MNTKTPNENSEFTRNKKYQLTSVLQASKERIKYIFEEFDLIEVSFSGGKDSGVVLELVLQYMKENNLNKENSKVILFSMDYEAGYQKTVDYAEYMFKRCEDYMYIYNVCLPVKTQNSVNADEYWYPWDENDKDIWVRDLPENSINYSNNDFDFNYRDMTDYEFYNAFSKYIYKKYNAKKCAVLVGIRTDESLNRLRVLYNEKNKYKDKQWSTKVHENIYSMFPIYDYHVSDIWKFNAKYNCRYNELYDLMYLANVPIGSMRVASPFNDSAVSSLKLYKVIDPNMWGKMVNRIKGVNSAGMYGDTKIYGWKNITLPKGHTWKSYTNFLLSTLDEEVRDNYVKKFNKSIKFWKEKGAALSEEIIEDLTNEGVEFINEGAISKASKNSVIRFPTYPDEANIKNWSAVGSWRRCAITILKNDNVCKTMGFAPTKSQRELRDKTMQSLKDL